MQTISVALNLTCEMGKLGFIVLDKVVQSTKRYEIVALRLSSRWN